VKYLILGALASAFMVFGIALDFRGRRYDQLLRDRGQADGTREVGRSSSSACCWRSSASASRSPAFPFQVWAPDVYQGAPAPTTAFLADRFEGCRFRPAAARGCSARCLSIAAALEPAAARRLRRSTILYGSLCAIPQRSVKRLMGYSAPSPMPAYLLLGVAAASLSGDAAILMLPRWLHLHGAGRLSRSSASWSTALTAMMSAPSPGWASALRWLATGLTVAMVSLAGIPPMAGFFGKFLLLKAVAAHMRDGHRCSSSRCWSLACGVVMSLYYYFGVVRAMFWPRNVADLTSIEVAGPTKLAILVCVVGVFYLGICPNGLRRRPPGGFRRAESLRRARCRRRPYGREVERGGGAAVCCLANQQALSGKGAPTFILKNPERIPSLSPGLARSDYPGGARLRKRQPTATRLNRAVQGDCFTPSG
jgi:NADH-quinone oxidoreductase subunit N